MDKLLLLEELSLHTYVMLKPSATAGTGVIAIRDIPKGCRSMFSRPDPQDKWILLSQEEVEALPGHAKFLVHNYCLYDENMNYYVLGNGFKKLDLSHFLNHSDTPNVRSIDDGEYFEALTDIRTGEELFIDYGTIVPGE
ncbi:MAG TPA: SET domain-containing protein [Cyclobacteriaceae bacterium]|nr:SET domain-containing protein [Cyclobacteriaceae bacterium]